MCSRFAEALLQASRRVKLLIKSDELQPQPARGSAGEALSSLSRHAAEPPRSLLLAINNQQLVTNSIT